MVHIPTSGSVRLHGGVANSSSWPVIEVNFDITFARDDPDHPDQVHFQMSNISKGNTYTSGKFGYNFQAAIGFDSPDAPDNWDDVWKIMDHSASQSSYWYNHLFDGVTDGGNRSGYFTCTSSSTTLKLYVRCYYGDYECCYNSNIGAYCYRNSHMFYKVYSQEVSVPPYQIDYTITYNANGGTGAPNAQTKTNLDWYVLLSSDIPTYLVNVTHHNNPDNVLSLNREFLKWNTNSAGTGTNYNPGQAYYGNANLSLYAQWGNATFSPVTVPVKTVKLTYVANGGTGIPAYDTFTRQSLGYNTSSSATTATYIPGTNYTTTTNLDLYPIYGTATVLYNNLPVPTRAGYTFKGWFTDPDFAYDTEIKTDFTITSDTSIYAKWELLPIHKLDEGGWSNTGPYVWRKVDNAWYKIAHTYKCVEVNGVKQWIDLVEAPQPADVFNHGTCLGRGLNTYYSDGMVEFHSENAARWVISNTTITRGHNGNSILTFGNICDRGNFKTLCIDCETRDGNQGHWNVFQIGYRWQRSGKGSGYNDWPNLSNYITYWDGTYPYNISRQVIRVNLNNFTAQPIYLELHACDVVPTIHAIWFE